MTRACRGSRRRRRRTTPGRWPRARRGRATGAPCATPPRRRARSTARRRGRRGSATAAPGAAGRQHVGPAAHAGVATTSGVAAITSPVPPSGAGRRRPAASRPSPGTGDGQPHRGASAPSGSSARRSSVAPAGSTVTDRSGWASPIAAHAAASSVLQTTAPSARCRRRGHGLPPVGAPGRRRRARCAARGRRPR